MADVKVNAIELRDLRQKAEAFDELARSLGGLIDVALWGGVSTSTLAEMLDLMVAGAKARAEGRDG